jgi:serine/threonine protein kinase
VGLCNLKNLAKKRKEKKIEWKESHLHFLLLKLVDFVILMDQHSYYHGDIKPENIVLESIFVNGNEFFDIRLIDFGIAVSNPL